MENKNYAFFGSKLNTFLLVVLTILMIIALRFMFTHKEIYFPGPQDTKTDTIPMVTGNKDDLVLFSIAPGSKVSGTMTATGSVKNAYFFEANIGVNILDANKNLLKAGNGTATTDWMTSGPVSFTTSLNFTGLPAGPGFIEIKNDNPSGDPTKDKSIFIPVVIQ